jgi:type I restriction enzyme S subunit
MTFNQECVGKYFSLSKGLGYLGKYLSSSDVGLIGLNSFDEGGSYKHGGEKEYSGPFKPEHIARPGDLFISTTDITQDGRVLASPMLLPDLSAEFSTVIFSGDIVKAVPRLDGLLPEFLYNILRVKSYRDRAAYASTGTTVRRIPVVVIERLEVPVPPLVTQNAINKIIGLIDEKIKLNSRMATHLEVLEQALFKSWFIDFDPVRALMAGEKPVGLDNATAALFPDSMEDSELGPIPSGWKLQSLSEIGEFRNGLAMQKLPVVDDRSVLPVIKIAQLRAGNTVGADLASGLIDPKFVVSDGDILFSWSGTLEIEHWAGGEGALNQHLFKVLGKTVPNWFIFSASRSHLSEFRKIASGKATTMGHIQRAHLDEAKVAVPPVELMVTVDGFFAALAAKKVSLLVENRTLTELRDALLPRLISGELQIPEEMLVS